MKCSFTLERSALLAMRELQSTDTTRFVLNAVYFEVDEKKNRVMLVATDGRVLGALCCSAEIIMTDDFHKCAFAVDYPLLRSLPKRDGDVRVSFNSDTQEVTFRTHDARLQRPSTKGPTLTVDVVQGDYPRWRGVIPPKDAKFVPSTWNFSLKLVLKFQKVATILCPRSGGVRLRSQDPEGTGPISIFIEHHDFYGVLMPMRNDGDRIPDWLEKETPAPAPAEGPS